MNQPPPVPPLQPDVVKPPPMSLLARLMNVFAIPGDVFEDVKATPFSVANWLAPILISGLVGVIATLIMFSQPAFVQQMQERQARVYDDMVKAGKMSRADADRTIAMVQKFSGPTVLKVTGSIGALFGSFTRVFGWALVLWLLGAWFLKVRFSYLKALEVAGLATMISTLGMIVALLLTVSVGKNAGPNLALTVSDFDEKSPTHLALAAANVFAIWFVAVMASGLARLAGVRFFRALFGVMGCWIVMQFFLIFVATGVMRLLGIQ